MQLLDVLDAIEKLQKEFLSGQIRSDVGRILIKSGINEREKKADMVIKPENINQLMKEFYLSSKVVPFTKEQSLYMEGVFALQFQLLLEEGLEEDVVQLQQLVDFVFNTDTLHSKSVWNAFEQVLNCTPNIEPRLAGMTTAFIKEASQLYMANISEGLKNIHNMHTSFLKAVLNTNVEDPESLMKSLDMEKERKAAEFKLICLLQVYINNRRKQGDSLFNWAGSLFTGDKYTMAGKTSAALSVQEAVAYHGLAIAAETAKEKMTQGESAHIRDAVIAIADKYQVQPVNPAPSLTSSLS